MRNGDFAKYAGARDWIFQNIIKRIAPGAARGARRGALKALRGLTRGEGAAAMKHSGGALHNIFVTEPAMKEVFGKHPKLADKVFLKDLRELTVPVDDFGKPFIDPSQLASAFDPLKREAAKVYGRSPALVGREARKLIEG